MILFNTKHFELYNYIIHDFLEIEIFGIDDEEVISDVAECIYPKYLYREQYNECIKILKELYQWTNDKFYHEMTAFHEIALNGFLEYMSDIQSDCPKFKKLYFNKKLRKMIKKAAIDDMNEIDDDFNLKDLEDMYYDINSYADNLFIDMDFLFLDLIYNNHKMGSTLIEDKLGINLDYYFEILPLDIQKQYKTKHITLSGEISSLLDYIENRIHNGNLNQLFWVDNRPVNEERIHLILENIMDAYFHNKDIEITREALVGNGKVDFSLLKNDNEKEKILIEVKRANSSYLKKGYENQLTKYMYASNCKNAFYLIACFTDSEYNTAYKFIRENVYTDEIQMYINIAVLDLRKKKSSIKILKKLIIIDLGENFNYGET